VPRMRDRGWNGLLLRHGVLRHMRFELQLRRDAVP
jgi:hypothetical protein